MEREAMATVRAKENMEETIEEISAENFKTWNEALASSDAEKVAELYLEKDDEGKPATLLPTLSKEIRFGRAEIAEYFRDHFLPKHPVGTIVSQDLGHITPEAYFGDGMYNFEVDDGKSGRKVIEARFTYIYFKVNGEWKIRHHHSSFVDEA